MKFLDKGFIRFLHRNLATDKTEVGDDHGLAVFKPQPELNKNRFGYRGKKKRYSVFKAEVNQKWSPFEEESCRDLCEKHSLAPESFIREEDNPNRKWHYAYHRVRKLVKKHEVKP